MNLQNVKMTKKISNLKKEMKKNIKIQCNLECEINDGFVEYYHILKSKLESRCGKNYLYLMSLYRVVIFLMSEFKVDRA